MNLYRRAWTMELVEGAERQYEEAHAAIWPALVQQMTADGIKHFVLYRCGSTVFAYQERSTPFPPADAIPSEITKMWWNSMSKLMVTDEHNKPIRKQLREIFSLTKEDEVDGGN